MVERNSILFVVLLCMVTACTPKPSISVLCERDKKGNYLLKWEIYPDVENVPVEVYMSENDSDFSSPPVKIVNSEDYIAMIRDTTDIHERKFFKLKVQGTYSSVVTNRFFVLDSVQNFRDMGGYVTNDNKQIRWGKVFRSGGLELMTGGDSLELVNLQIRTVVDIQPRDNRMPHDSIQNKHYVRIPITNESYETISQEIIDGRFLRGDALIYSQDIYKDMVENYTKEYTEFFNLLLDSKNYPLVYNCNLGKDQSGLASYLLLRALNVPKDVAEDDYMRSSQGIDRYKLVENVDSLSEPMQEALTMLTETDISILKYGLNCMKTKSGSIDKYMTTELGLTAEKRKQLRDILLY